MAQQIWKTGETLEAQVQEFSGPDAIQTLRFRYHEYVNEKKPESSVSFHCRCRD